MLTTIISLILTIVLALSAHGHRHANANENLGISDSFVVFSDRETEQPVPVMPFIEATPEPTPEPAPKPAPVQRNINQTAHSSTKYYNRVIGPGVNASIAGTYSDCTGHAPVGWSGAYFDSCFSDVWIMAHPAFFGAMNSWTIGTQVSWWDSGGVEHAYHITGSTVYPPNFHIVDPGGVHFQVCVYNIPSGSPVRVLTAA